jgi:hypothetical protein
MRVASEPAAILILSRAAGRPGPQHAIRLEDAPENLLTLQTSANRCDPAIGVNAAGNVRVAGAPVASGGTRAGKTGRFRSRDPIPFVDDVWPAPTSPSR